MLLRGLMFGGLLVVLAGCGSGAPRLATVPVSGSVKYKGQPVSGALVSFASVGAPRTATGLTNAQGEFKLTTVNTDDGAVAGEHTITITKSTAVPTDLPKSPEEYAKAMQGTKAAKPPGADSTSGALPSKYSDPGLSGLKRTVVAGESNVFNIELTD
jgi:hypothetical protein